MSVAIGIVLIIIGFGRMTLANGHGIDHANLGHDNNMIIGAALVFVGVWLLPSMRSEQ